MAELIIKRPMTMRDWLRRYAVEVDGIRVAHIKAGGTAHVTVAEGMRSLRLSLDGYSSPLTTFLASDGHAAILHVAPASQPSMASRRDISPLSRAARLLPERSSYLEVRLEDPAGLAKAFLQAAWSAACSQIHEQARPGTLSRYGLTAGDLSVLFHGCRTADARMITTPGSANDRLWTELVSIGWLARAKPLQGLPTTSTAYRMTKIGQQQLLDLFSGPMVAKRGKAATGTAPEHGVLKRETAILARCVNHICFDLSEGVLHAGGYSIARDSMWALEERGLIKDVSGFSRGIRAAWAIDTWRYDDGLDDGAPDQTVVDLLCLMLDQFTPGKEGKVEIRAHSFPNVVLQEAVDYLARIGAIRITSRTSEVANTQTLGDLKRFHGFDGPYLEFSAINAEIVDYDGLWKRRLADQG